VQEKKENRGTTEIAPVGEVIEILEREFGVPQIDQRKSPLDELIFTILSQNTNDVNRDRAYTSLRKSFPSWDEVLEAQEGEIADAIRVGGLAQTKSVRIKEILSWVKKEFGRLSLDFLFDMPVPEAKQILSSLKGVGPKTICCVLLFSCGKSVFPVDTHILRIAKRFRWVPENASSEQAHKILGQLVPLEKMFSFHINLIRHGRETCKSRNPLHSSCPIPSCPCKG
jgi:endonuclease-3